MLTYAPLSWQVTSRSRLADPEAGDAEQAARRTEPGPLAQSIGHLSGATPYPALVQRSHQPRLCTGVHVRSRLIWQNSRMHQFRAVVFHDARFLADRSMRRQSWLLRPGPAVQGERRQPPRQLPGARGHPGEQSPGRQGDGGRGRPRLGDHRAGRRAAAAALASARARQPAARLAPKT